MGSRASSLPRKTRRARATGGKTARKDRHKPAVTDFDPADMEVTESDDFVPPDVPAAGETGQGTARRVIDRYFEDRHLEDLLREIYDD